MRNRVLVAEDIDRIDNDWIKSVRKWWKKLLSESKRASDAYDVLVYLESLLDAIDTLSKDLLFRKGFYKAPSSGFEAIKRDALERLKKVRGYIRSSYSEVKSLIPLMDPSSKHFSIEGGFVYRYYQQKDPRSPQRAFNKAMREKLREVLKKADNMFSRSFLGYLTRHVNRGDVYPNKRRPDQKIDLEFSLGRVRVVFQDFSGLTIDWGHDSPLDLMDKRLPKIPSYRPVNPKAYIPHLKRAKALLESKGLGYLWYGALFIRCKTCGGVNPYGEHFGVGGHYYPRKDVIAIYSNPDPFITELVLHEIGHRYYYRFMSKTDRGKFDSYFAGPSATFSSVVQVLTAYVSSSDKKELWKANDSRDFDTIQDLVRKYYDKMKPEDQKEVKGWLRGVPAVSNYGQVVSPEDFAEVFAYYVMGRRLSRAQVERFKEFLNRKRRMAFEVAARWLDVVRLAHERVQPDHTARLHRWVPI